MFWSYDYYLNEIRGQRFPPRLNEIGYFTRHHCMFGKSSHWGFLFCYDYHLLRRRDGFKELSSNRQRDRLAFALAAPAQEQNPRTRTFVSFSSIPRRNHSLRAPKNLRERKSLFTLSEWSCQDILSEPQWPRRLVVFSVLPAKENVSDRGQCFLWTLGSRAESCHVGSFVKCSRGAEHVPLAGPGFTGVSSAERVAHSGVAGLASVAEETLLAAEP